MRYKGLVEIRKFLAMIPFIMMQSGGYECFARNSEDWETCTQKIDWLNKGLKKITSEENVFKVADERLAGFGFAGFDHLIENKLEGGLHPGKLVQHLLQKVQSMGVQVITGIEVLNYNENGHSLTVYTNKQIDFLTNQLLLCTNAFTKELVPSMDIVPTGARY